MPIDPAQGYSLTPEGRQADRIAALERRLAALENGAPTIQVGSGAPTTAPRDGTPYLDNVGHVLYVRSGGTWRLEFLT